MESTYREQVHHWKKRVRTMKLPDKSKLPYCIHEMKIGGNQYSFLERRLPNVEGILVNPGYKVDKRLPRPGGRVARYGELFFWEYWEPEKGWYIVRELTFNEKICVALIHDEGYFRPHTQDNETR